MSLLYENESYKIRGTKLRSAYQPDLICFEKVIIETKAVNALTDVDRAQVQNYLKATGLRLGLLINFGHAPHAEIERIVL